MDLSIAYWILILLWLVLGLWSNWPLNGSNARAGGGSLLLFLLLVIIGVKVFGAPLNT